VSVDFPRAWQIARGVPVLDHDPKCSYRVEDGGALCDCRVLTQHSDYLDSPLHSVRERGLIFTGESIPGLQSGAKTQSRRVIVPRKGGVITGPAAEPNCAIEAFGGGAWNVPSRMEARPCPYGEPGDLIWVKEAFALLGKQTIYRADKLSQTEGYSHVIRNGGRWKSPRFMPKVAARIWLELTRVRIERLQDISEEDVLAEGLRRVTKDQGRTWKYGMADRDGLPGTDDTGWPWQRWSASPQEAYASLWDELNAKRGFPWKDNPWVWVLEFRLLER
jgi:hypothetical protein